MDKFLKLVFFGFFTLFFLSIGIATEVQVKVTKKADDRLGVVVTNLAFSENVNSEQSEEYDNVLRNDLISSGHFIVAKMSPALFNASKKDAHFNKLNVSVWENFREEIIIKGSLIVSSNGLIFQGFAFDRETGRNILAKKYTADKKMIRKIIHQFADDLVMTLTGFRGICTLKIAFVRTLSREVKEVFMSDYDGANEVQVTRDQTLTMSPKWSPRSLALMYTSYKTGFPTVMMHFLQSGQRNILSKFPGFNGSASFSPDGDKIAFVLSKDGNPEIYIMKSDGSGKLRKTKSRSVDESPVWSPDGRKLAFVSDRRGSVQIYRMDLRTNKLDRLTFSGSYNTSPSWNPIQDQIAYTRVSHGKGKIYILDLKTKETELIASGEDADWAPDGRHLVYIDEKNGVKQIFIIDVNTKIRRQITWKSRNCLTPSWTLY